MIKRVLIGSGLALVLGLLFFGRNAASYVRTSLGYVRDSVQGSVPVEFELQRARQMIKDLDPEIRKNMHLVAKEEVEVQQLEQRIAQMEARLTEDRADILRLKSDLEKGKDKSTFVYGGRKYTPEDVKTDLAARFQRFKTSEATLGDVRKIHQARVKSVDAARQKLEGWLASKRQLQVEVENLEAKRQMIAAAQSTSNYRFDDSQLGRVKELVGDVRTRLEVEDRLVSAEDTFHDEIPVRETATGNIVDQIGEYFSPKPAEKKPEAKELAKNTK